MNVAFEMSPLITASGTFGDKSGVYRYTIGLLDAYIKYTLKKDKVSKIILFSFNRDLMKYPLNPDVLRIAQHPRVIILNRIPKVSQKSMLERMRDTVIMDVPIIRTLLSTTSRILAIRKINTDIEGRINFHNYLSFLEKNFQKNGVKIVYHSDTGFYKMPGYKNVVTVYDLTALTMSHMHREDTTDLQKRKMRFARLWSRGIVCISNNTKKDLLKFSQEFRSKKIAVCYPGLDHVFKKRIDNTEGSLVRVNKILKPKKIRVKAKHYLLYYGTFEPRKNLIYLVRAFCELVEEGSIPKNFRLIMTGGEGWGRVKKLVQNYISENYQIAEESNVIILSFMRDENLIDFIQNAVGTVYPSLYEGFGLPVLESMAMGTPVICSNTSSLPEVGGHAVLYINPHDFYDIKDKIKLLINDPKLGNELQKKGLEQNRKFTWNKTAATLYDFFKSL